MLQDREQFVRLMTEFAQRVFQEARGMRTDEGEQFLRNYLRSYLNDLAHRGLLQTRPLPELTPEAAYELCEVTVSRHGEVNFNLERLMSRLFSSETRTRSLPSATVNILRNGANANGDIFPEDIIATIPASGPGSLHWAPREEDPSRTRYIPGRGTVRDCLDCGTEVDGGPTRCMRCATNGAQTDPEEERRRAARTPRPAPNEVEDVEAQLNRLEAGWRADRERQAMTPREAAEDLRQELVRDLLVYGNAATDGQGHRVDPRTFVVGADRGTVEAPAQQLPGVVPPRRKLDV